MELVIASQDDNVVRIQVSGGITQKQLHQSEEILPKLAGKDVYTKKVLLDLQSNDFIDSSGINWLLLCHKRFIENNGRMVLHSIPQLVDSVLKILRMESVFDIAVGDADALKMAMSARPAPPAPPAPETPASETPDPSDDGEESTA